MSTPTPAAVHVCFTHTAPAEHSGAIGASYCASGSIYLGTLELLDADGRALLSLPVQSGGWMCEDSPFRRAGLCPPVPTPGAYDPLCYPDTAFPALQAPTTLGTCRTGRLRGFRIPDPPGTGRSFLMVHSSTRRGSEGCITTPPGDSWEGFCAAMAALHAAGVLTLPLTVTYATTPPDPLRSPASCPGSHCAE